MPFAISSSLLRSGGKAGNYGAMEPLLDEPAATSDAGNDKKVAKLIRKIDKGLSKCQTLSYKISEIYETPLPMKKSPIEKPIASDPQTRLYYKCENIVSEKKRNAQEIKREAAVKKHADCLTQEEAKLELLKTQLANLILSN